MSVKESKSTQELLARIRDLEIENRELEARLDRCQCQMAASPSVSLITLPEEMLREIVGYLGFRDQGCNSIDIFFFSELVPCHV